MFLLLRAVGGLEPIPADFLQEVGYTLCFLLTGHKDVQTKNSIL